MDVFHNAVHRVSTAVVVCYTPKIQVGGTHEKLQMADSSSSSASKGASTESTTHFRLLLIKANASRKHSVFIPAHVEAHPRRASSMQPSKGFDRGTKWRHAFKAQLTVKRSYSLSSAGLGTKV